MNFLKPILLAAIIALLLTNIAVILRQKKIPLESMAEVARPVADTNLRFDGVYWQREKFGRYFKFFPNGKVISSIQNQPIEAWYDGVTLKAGESTDVGVGDWISQYSSVAFSIKSSDGTNDYLGFISRIRKDWPVQNDEVRDIDALTLGDKSKMNENLPLETFLFHVAPGVQE